jgi:hypothetical protein
MIDHILLATPTRIIGHGKESFLSEHWALTPDAPLFAKIDGIVGLLSASSLPAKP